MRSESNHESIRMKCEDFYCIAEKAGSRMESIIEWYWKIISSM